MRKDCLFNKISEASAVKNVGWNFIIKSEIRAENVVTHCY